MQEKKKLQARSTANNSQWFNNIQWNVNNLCFIMIKRHQEDKLKKNCDGTIMHIFIFLSIPLDWQNKVCGKYKYV